MKLDNTKKCFMCLWLEDWGSFMCSFPLPNSTAFSALDAPFPITSSAVAFSGLCLPLPSVFLSAWRQMLLYLQSFFVAGGPQHLCFCLPQRVGRCGRAAQGACTVYGRPPAALPKPASLCVPGFGPVLKVVTRRLALLFSPSVPGTQRL